MAGPKEAQQIQVKRYHGRNNVVVWLEYQLAHKLEVRGDRDWSKEEKAHV